MPKEYATAETFRRATANQLQPILNVLSSIEWPCPATHIPLIIERLGWVHTRDLVGVEANTRLPLNRATGNFSQPDGQFTRLGFPVSDYVSEDDPAALQTVSDDFPIAVRDMESILGPRSFDEYGEHKGAAWDLESGGRIRLDCIDIGLQARLLSRDLADAERFEETHDMSEFYDDEDE